MEVTPDPRWIASEINKVRLVSPNGTDVLLDEDKVKLSEVGYVLERKVFDKHLAMDAARAGAQIMVKTLATSMEKEKDGIIVHLEHMGNPMEIKAKIVIGADGPESRVGRWAGLKTGLKPGNMESCAQFEMVGVDMKQPGCLELVFGSVAPGGYAWIFPKGEDIANVGLGVLSTKTDKTAYQHLFGVRGYLSRDPEGPACGTERGVTRWLDFTKNWSPTMYLSLETLPEW